MLCVLFAVRVSSSQVFSNCFKAFANWKKQSKWHVCAVQTSDEHWRTSLQLGAVEVTGMLEHEPDELSRTERTECYTHIYKCCIFQCAQLFGKETNRWYTSTLVSHIHSIRFVVVHGLRIFATTILSLWCWMLFDEFLFIFSCAVFVMFFRLCAAAAAVRCRLIRCALSLAQLTLGASFSLLHLFVWNVSHSDSDSGVLGAVQCSRSLSVCFVYCRFYICSKSAKPNKMDLIFTFVRFKRIVCARCSCDCEMRKTENPNSYVLLKGRKKSQQSRWKLGEKKEIRRWSFGLYIKKVLSFFLGFIPKVVNLCIRSMGFHRGIETKNLLSSAIFAIGIIAQSWKNEIVWMTLARPFIIDKWHSFFFRPSMTHSLLNFTALAKETVTQILKRRSSNLFLFKFVLFSLYGVCADSKLCWRCISIWPYSSVWISF